MIARNRPLLLSLCFFFLTISVAGAAAVPALRGRVNDYAQILTPEQSNALDAQLARLEQDTGHQVAVLTLPSLDGEDIEGFSIRVAENWKIGKKGFDNGVILIVAVNDRKLRLEVGYGLEGILPDLTANRIIRDYIVPLFRSGDFAAGIVSGINAVEKVIRKEPLPETARKQAQGRGSSLNFIVMLLITFGVLGLFGFSSAANRRGNGMWA
ncbi:MAG TPA: TPM domain-containing protein, partial [Candidatus Saccharimonadales bacterium]|nr:TPM domain-containing protein [Candidatus Saccharimonadales bacterium]